MPLRKVIARVATRGYLWMIRRNVVARFEGIAISDVASSDTTTRVAFRDTILAALRLLQEVDPIRFARVQRRLHYILHATLSTPGRAQYEHRPRTCTIDFIAPARGDDRDWMVANHACILVHEATHGVIEARGIPYNYDHRLRIEEICWREEQRLACKLAHRRPELTETLIGNFDPTRWHSSWAMSAWQEHIATMRRIFSKDRRANSAPPDHSP